jgi:hypothetical protein
MGVVRLVALCDLGDYCHLSPEELEEHLERTWIRLGHRDYIRRKLSAIWEYLAVCESQGLPPLRCTVGFLARKIRAYRTEHHFYDCV